MGSREEQLAHLERLARELDSDAVTAEIVRTSRPHLKVANASMPKLNERVYCGQAEGDSWVFQWPWWQPIGSVNDLGTVAGKIIEVLRPVGET